MAALSSPHLIVPFASCEGEDWLQSLKSLPAGSLKHLGKLLQGMKPVAAVQLKLSSLSTPHEKVLAEALGLAPAADGLIPWAAVEAARAGQPEGRAWAFITPCHWSMGREHATMTDPAALALTSAESHTLLAAMQPYFETDGVTLHYAAPDRWLAEGEVFRQLATASLDRVLGRNVDPWLPGAKTAPSLRRLQNEMQMLLYTHVSNDERSLRRLSPVNSFWISGTGALGQPLAALDANIVEQRKLAQAAFTGDWNLYAQAWAELDNFDIAHLLAQQNAGQTVKLSLCGEQGAQTFQTAPQGIFSRISSLLSPQPPLNVLQQL